MEEKYFYVYKWFNTETNEVFYIGKGCNDRYKETYHRNKKFLEYYNNNSCSSEIIEFFEYVKINRMKRAEGDTAQFAVFLIRDSSNLHILNAFMGK